MKRQTVPAVTIVWLISASVLAEAVVLCARARQDGTFSTSVKIRESCRAGETQLNPAALGLQGPPGGLVVKDANGALVGIALENDTAPLNPARYVYAVRAVAGGTYGKFVVNEEGFVSAGSLELYFESGDCSGGPLLQLAGGEEVRLIRDVRQPAFPTFYYPDTPLQDRTTCSRCSVGASSTCAATCTPGCQLTRTVPAVPLVVADLGLMPPFSVAGP